MDYMHFVHQFFLMIPHQLLDTISLLHLEIELTKLDLEDTYLLVVVESLVVVLDQVHQLQVLYPLDCDTKVSEQQLLL